MLLLIGALSDWADGWMARKAGGGSSWGARLDPLADKLLISAPLIWLAADQRLPLWAVWLLLARELLISGWRSGSQGGAPASWLGKWKTTFQFLSLFLMRLHCRHSSDGQQSRAKSQLTDRRHHLVLRLCSMKDSLLVPKI